MKAWLSVALVLVTVDSVGAQVRDRAASLTGGASIAGTLLSDSQPAAPVRRATVTVNSTDRRVGKTVITDDAGKFLVTGLPAGPYLIAAIKRGWVMAQYGSKAPGRPGRPLALADGARATVTMRMARGAAITGTILDHTGQPASGATVRVMRYAYTPTGERRLVPTGSLGPGSAGPDERGVYRVWGLAPGEYYVSVTGLSFFMGQARELFLTSDVDVQEAQRALQTPGAPLADVPQRAVGVAPTFYPGSTDVAQSTPIVLRAGEERSGIDMTLQYVSTSRISGNVAGMEGDQPVQVFLLSQSTNAPEMGFESIRSVRTTAGGAFEFGGVRPGRYAIAARGNPPAAAPGVTPTIMAAIADVEVHGEDVRGLSLQLQEGLSVSGVVRFEGTAPPPPLTSVRISLATADPAGFSISSGSTTPKPDGSFTIGGVSPGRYRLTATVPGTPAVWTLRSSVAAGQDALDNVVDIREPITGAEITLTDRQAELTGTIQDAAGTAADYTIVLYSADRKHWGAQTRRVVTARAANDGTFAFRNLPAGEYMMAAVEDVEPGEWYDPSFLQRLLPTSMKVAIADGEKKVQNIRVAPRQARGALSPPKGGGG